MLTSNVADHYMCIFYTSIQRDVSHTFNLSSHLPIMIARMTCIIFYTLKEAKKIMNTPRNKARKYNTIQLVYQYQKPFLYGSICKIEYDNQELEWTDPFVISKRISDDKETVYGTVSLILNKIQRQVNKLRRFNAEAQERLRAAGIAPVSRKDGILSGSKIADEIINETEELMEEILLIVSVNIRILSEIFPKGRFDNNKIPIYNHKGDEVDIIKLTQIPNLLVHNRYILINSPYVVDLFSDEKFMTEPHAMGFKFNFQEYLTETKKLVNSVTVQDLAEQLQTTISCLSTQSDVKDIIFVTQNLHAFGEAIVDANGSLKYILNKMAKQYIKNNPSQGSKTKTRRVRFLFTAPKVYLEPKLDKKQIRIEVVINGQQEKLVMCYKDFFKEILAAFKNKPLISSPIK